MRRDRRSVINLRRGSFGVSEGMVMPFTRGVFVNSSSRYILHSNSLTGPFAANQLATRMIAGRRYAQLYRSVTEDIPSTALIEDFSAWGGYQTNIETDVTENPLGITNADRVYATGAANDEHNVSFIDGSIITGTHVLGVYAKPGTKGDGLQLARYVDVANNYFSLQFIFSTQTFYISDSQSVIDNYGYISLANGWYFVYVIYTLTEIPSNKQVLICILDDFGEQFYVADGEEMYFWGFQYDYISRYPSYQKLAKGTYTKDEFYYPSANIPAWLYDGFTQHIIFNGYDSTMLAADGGQKVIASFDATAETITVYLDGADNKVHVLGSVSGQFVESAVLTWSLGQHAVVKLQFDNGSNSVLTTSNFTTGNGAVTGIQISDVDGNIAHGMNHTTLDEQFDGLLAQLEPV